MLASLEPEALRAHAREVVRPGVRAPHWSQIASIIGTAEDRGLYREWGFGSTRAWAESDLDLGASETMESLRLWQLIGALGRPVDAWALVSKAKAKTLLRAVSLGANLSDWFVRALQAESADALRDELQRATGAEVWEVVAFSLPVETADLLRASMVLALSHFLEPGEMPPDVETARAMIEDRRYAHRCLECLAKEFVEREAAR